MNYDECLEYIHGVSWTFCKPGLERIGELCKRLGEPQKELKFVHVAGTNGKGSFCAMLDSVLRSAGYKVGLYTSPYITVFNERMRINGENISNGELISLTEQIKPIADGMSDKPTEFELITALAFEYFRRNRCDIVILEAGMGGRLDSTNIIENSVLSVITGIALDHTAFLGDTVEKIAAEKAGIIKNGRPVLYGGTDRSAFEIIRNAASEKGSRIYSVDYSALRLKQADLDGSVFDFGEHKDMTISLLGAYQPRNAASVITAAELLKGEGFAMTDGDLRRGLSSAVWQGRFELISSDPAVIFDGAHNPQGIDAAVESIKLYFGDEKVWLFSGVLRDKDYNSIARSLSTVASRAFTVTPESPRALDAREYADVLSEAGIQACPMNGKGIREAFDIAREEAKKSGVPLVCLGSLYVYASLLLYK